jgi:hypothetical protein
MRGTSPFTNYTDVAIVLLDNIEELGLIGVNTSATRLNVTYFISSCSSSGAPGSV